MQRYKVNAETVKRVRGLDFIIKTNETLDYDGEWHFYGFHVFLGTKKVAFFVGYPTNEDLAKIEIS